MTEYISDAMPPCDDDWLEKRLTAIDLEELIERYQRPGQSGLSRADAEPGGAARVERMRKLISWMESHGVERLERPDPQAVAIADTARNLAREGDEDRSAAKRDAERAAAVTAMIKREDRKERKGKAA